MVDANAAPGPRDDVGVLCDGFPTTVNTNLFGDFLSACHLGLLCTGSMHQGELTTWISPDGMTEHCVDYVAVGLSQVPTCTFSSVVEELGLGHSSWDHQAVAVQLQWQDDEAWIHEQPSRRRSLFDPAQITCATSTAGLQDYEPSPWSTDIIEAHVQQFSDHILSRLAQTCPLGSDRPKKPFFDEELWILRKQKMTARRRMKNIERRAKDERLVVVFFHIWRRLKSDNEHMEEPSTLAEHISYIASLHCFAVCHFHDLSQSLKCRIKHARQRHLALVFENMDPGASASAVLHALRPILGPSNLKKLKTSSLPLLRKEDGSLCQTPQEARETWAEFFRQMEGGIRMSEEDQRSHCRSLRLICMKFRFSWILSGRFVVPNRRKQWVRASFIQPFATVCRVASRENVFPSFSSSVFEDKKLLFTKGATHPIYKHKGPIDTRSSFRSILVSSHVGKCLHRAIRQRQHTLFDRYLQRELIGGRHSVPVTLGVHIARAFFTWARDLRTQCWPYFP